jgi:hypothetical protein
MPNVKLSVTCLEFNEGQQTIWVHNKGGTVLRIKCSGKITINDCESVVPHCDLVVEGDVNFCIPPKDDHLQTRKIKHLKP